MADRGGRGRGGFNIARGGSDPGRRGSVRGRGVGDRGRGAFDGGRGRGSVRGRGGSQGGRDGGDSTPRYYGDGTFPQPDAEVTKTEDALVKDLSAAFAGTSLVEQLPRRPGYGTAGQKIVLWTNYLVLKGIDQDTTLYRYSVVIKGEKNASKGQKKRLIQLLLKQEPFSEVASASDWAQLIITTQKVELKGGRAQYKITWYPEDEAPPTGAQNRNTFILLVEDIGSVSLHELVRDLSTSTSTYPLKQETIQALNITLSYGPSTDTKIANAGQNKYFPIQGHPQFVATNLGFGLEALRGYYMSVRTSVSRMLVNINIAHGAFYKPVPLLQLMREAGGAPNTIEEYRRLVAFVRKVRVETNYIPDKDRKGKAKMGKDGKPLKKRKVHTITDLSPFNKTAQTTSFDLTDASGNSRTVTVEQYFLQTYNIRLTTPQAPCINYGTEERPMWIPSELCTVLPGQPARKILLGDQTRQMIQFAARRPFHNATSITGDGLEVTKIQPVSQGLNTNLLPFGITVTTSLLTVHGRILPAPVLQYKGNTCQPTNGAWNLDVRRLGDKPFCLAGALPSWNCLVINSGQKTIFGGADKVRQLLELFRATLSTYGMRPGPVQNPVEVEIALVDLQKRNISKIRQQILQTLQSKVKEKPKFLFVLLPSDNAVVYDCVKYVCDIEAGIPSICSIGSKFSKEKGQIQYFSNVAMKFNQKLGGMNHGLQGDRYKPLDARTIIFGIDVTHPSPGSSETSPSIAGIVASVDSKFSQYPASIRTQKGKEEMVQELQEMIIERLELWRKRNGGMLPNKVIIYRDGVSEGQYKKVLESEYPSFVGAFSKLYGAVGKHPKISIIVVGKRHHTRFYPTTMKDSDQKTGNPQPGTVVDRGVTGEKLFDFFLLAHQGLQGTSKPAHYVVIKDENKLGADQLQNLTHNLCYTFARATRSVSLCPPAYYADLLCERGRCYLHNVLKGDGSVKFSDREWHSGVHPNLAGTMFYL